MSGKRLYALCQKVIEGLSYKKIALIMVGAMICSFGIHNIHQQTGITEGGVIGLMLLAEHWLVFLPPILHLYWILAVIYWRLNIWGEGSLKHPSYQLLACLFFIKFGNYFLLCCQIYCHIHCWPLSAEVPL